MPSPNNPSAGIPFEVSEGLNSAIAFCQLRGAQMTPLRQAVLRALWYAERPLGAYDLRDLVEKRVDRKVPAASIYRTLDFLCDHGVAARIESCNAYVACIHPDRDHACFFLVCETCGDATEIENPKVEQLIGEDAKRLGFAVKRRVVEMSGVCGPCRNSPSSD